MYYADFESTKIDKQMLYSARRNARLTIQEAADLCGIHRTTFERQENGSSKVNTTVFRLLLMRGGWLPDEFEGWKIGQGMLWSPEDVSFSPGEIRSLPYLYALIAELKRELKKANGDNTKLPEPEIGPNVVPFRKRSG